MFAAAAPTMALVTYFGLSQVIIYMYVYLLQLDPANSYLVVSNSSALFQT